MILAPFLSGATGIWQEQILVTIDAVLYCVLAVCAVAVAPGVDVDGSDGGVLGSLAFFLTICTTVAVWRHIQNARSPAHQDDTPRGNLKRPPVVTAVQKPLRASLLYWLPVALQWLSLIWFFIDPATPNTGATLLLVIGAYSHLGLFRSHGDQCGGKYVLTMFVLMLHLTAVLSGTPPGLALYLHHAMVLFTYFFTGLNKGSSFDIPNMNDTLEPIGIS